MAKRCPNGYCPTGECDCSVAGSSSSSAPSRPATKAAVCEDCGAELETAMTGRPKKFCDATCRKNAKRFRDWERYLRELGEWRRRDAKRRREREAAQADWDATLPPKLTGWRAQARDAGWTPPGGWFAYHDAAKTAAIGKRPSDYRTPATDPEPAKVEQYRSGARGTWW